MTRQAPVLISSLVPAEIYALGKSIESVMVEYKKAKDHGLSVGEEIPAILMGSLKDLLSALSGLSEIAPEFKEDSILAVKALLNPILDGLSVLLKK